jgi:dienelactone hydrolase
MKNILVIVIILFMASLATAQVTTKVITYSHNGTELEGYLAYKEGGGKKPGIIIVHQWKGLGDYEKKRAEMLAELGYVAFAVDVYGKGIRPTNPKEAGEQAGKYRNDRPLLRARVQAGLDKLKSMDMVDAGNVAAMGYCFGGGAVLELARSGADVKGVISFHGNLDTPNPADANNIKGKVLVLHGAIDPNVPRPTVDGFVKEMEDAKVDYYLVEYGGAVHSFTDWNAGTDVSKGSAYNEKADKRSWEEMQEFYKEIFQ